jgi:serine protease Do
MMRTVAWTLGAVALAAGLAAPNARAGEPAGDQKRIEKRVLIRHGGGFLGVTLEDVEGDARGAAVRSVESDTPAGKAGIKEGDVIVRFDGETVRSAAQLARMVGETPAGRSVAIEVLRAGKPEKLTVTLGEGNRMWMRGEGMPGERGLHFALPVPPEPPDVSVENNVLHVRPREPRRLGVEFIDMGEQLAAAYKLETKSGVLVASVEAGGAAAQAGIKAGDVLLELDGHEIENGRDLREAVADTKPGERVTVKLQREGRPLELEVTMGGVEPRREQGPSL